MSDLNIASLIYDSFVYDGSYIVVLNTQDDADTEFGKLLMFGRVEHAEGGSRVVPVYEEEYNDIVEYYQLLQSAFMKDEEDVE